MTEPRCACRWPSRPRGTAARGGPAGLRRVSRSLPPGTLVRVPLGRRDVPGIVWQRAADARTGTGRAAAAGERVLSALPPLAADVARADRLRRRLLPARRRRTGAGGAAARTAQARRHRGWRARLARLQREPPSQAWRRPAARRRGPNSNDEQAAALAAIGPRRPRRCCCTASPAAARPRSTCTPPRPRSQPAGRRWCWCPRSTSRRSSRRASPRASRAALHGQPAQRPDAGAAAAPLAAGAPGAGRPGAGHAAGGVRADAAAGAHRRRRGARPVVQAAGRRALLGARPRGLARAPASACRCCWARPRRRWRPGSGRWKGATCGWRWTAAHRRRRDAARCGWST